VLYQLSYGGERLLQERERRQVSPDHLLSPRRAADGHELPRVGRVVLDDSLAWHPDELEPCRDRLECALVGDDEHDGVRAARQVPRAALSARVQKVRGEDAQRKVATDNRVVTETGFFSRAPVRRLTEWSSCDPEATTGGFVCQRWASAIA
jgi:hypothetical protein